MRFRHLVDAFAFSSLLPAAIAYSLSWVASLALIAPNGWHSAALAGCGAFIVYNLDRLRDTDRDRKTSPDRTAFVERYRRLLTGLVGIVSVVFASLVMTAPLEVIGIILPCGLLGLLHRRLKRAAAIKALYVSLAWVGVCIGIPWLSAGRPQAGCWAAAIVLPILAANLISSDLRDNETQFFHGRPALVLRSALCLAAFGVLLAVAAPPPLTAFAWIGLAEAAAILGFRPGERYGMIFIDGALWAGSGIAALHLAIGW